MRWIRRHKKKLIWSLVALVLLVVGGVYGGIEYYKSRFFAELPNTLTIEGTLTPVPFRWVSQKLGEDYSEPHSAILLPVRVPGLKNQFYMQFDTGSPYTFLRSGCLEEIREHGVKCDMFQEEDRTYVRGFELKVGDNKVVLAPGRVLQRDISMNWEDPGAINIIGSIGADFIDDIVVAVDFPAKTVHLYRERPAQLQSLGAFARFDFKARRVMLPAKIDGTEMPLFWDSGCSSFGLLTSRYHFENYANPGDQGILFEANRFGDKVPIHHRPCDLVATLGETEVPLKRVSYVRMYSGLQTTFGRFIDGGFFGNKSLTDSTLILDTKANEFLVLNESLSQREGAEGK